MRTMNRWTVSSVVIVVVTLGLAACSGDAERPRNDASVDTSPSAATPSSEAVSRWAELGLAAMRAVGSMDAVEAEHGFRDAQILGTLDGSEVLVSVFDAPYRRLPGSSLRGSREVGTTTIAIYILRRGEQLAQFDCGGLAVAVRYGPNQSDDADSVGALATRMVQQLARC